MILVVAHDTTFGNAHLIKQAVGGKLITYEEEIWRPEIQDTIDGMIRRDAEKCRGIIAAADKVLLVGASAFRILDDLDNPPLPETEIWYTDSAYLRYSRAHNERAQEMGIKRVFAMPDLMHLAPQGTKPLLHPISLMPEAEKPNVKTIAHSPGTKGKRWQKGSDEIEAVIDELRTIADYDFIYNCIMHKSHQECLQQKMEAHIFIDKLLTVDGPSRRLRFGLGKSGLEALAAGCVTLCAHPIVDNKYFEMPPIIRIDDMIDLDIELRQLLEMDTDELTIWGLRGRKWIAQYWAVENGAWLQYYEGLCSNSS